MNLGIVYTPTRVDLYREGEFFTSIPAGIGYPLPAYDMEAIEAYVCDGQDEQFISFIQGKHFKYFKCPCLIETDEDLVIIRKESISKISLWSLYYAALTARSEAIDRIQQQAGFFPMNESQKESTINYLFTCLKELSTRPKVLCVPVFAWFNYAFLDESDVDESAVLQYIEIPGSVLFDEADKLIAHDLQESFKKDIPSRCILRSALLCETINLLKT